MEGERVSAEPAAASEPGRVAMPAGAQGPAIATIQRWAGNRALGRLLQRHEDEELGEHTHEEELVLGEEVDVAQPLADAAAKEREKDQASFSTPLPSDATKTAGGTSYNVVRGGAKVEIKKDATGGKSTYTAWKWDFATRPKYSHKDGAVSSVTTPEVKTTIQTTYEKGATGAEDSAYGRGTTEEDKKAGTISLRFHEACHGKDYLDYMAAHPVPTLGLAVGDPADGAQAKIDAYVKAVDQWHIDGLSESETNTDQVGTPGEHTH